MAEDLQSLRRSLLGERPGAIVKGMEKAGQSITNLRNDLLQQDLGFDQSGVPDFGLRSGLSRADTDKERKAFLNEWAGPKGWTQDRFGAYALTPAGMTRLGYPHKGKPVLIDEPWSLTRYDIADLTGEAPAIAGATAAGVATGGAGFIPGVLATAAGAGLGKAAGEGVEEFRGENLQTFPQVMGDVGIEGLMGAAGEGLFRGVLAPLGRKMMGPNVSRMTPEKSALAEQARTMGAQPSISQIAQPPIMGRMQGMINMVLGDPLAAKNAAAITKEVSRLRAGTGRAAAGRQAVGEDISRGISRSRKALSRWSGQVAGKIDEMTGGYAVVPNNQIKAEAQAILDSLPRKKPVTTGEPGFSYVDDLTGQSVTTSSVQTREGKIVFASPELVKSLEDILDVPNAYTITETQQMTSRLFDAIGNDTIIPGINARNARLLYKAATRGYDDIADDTLRNVVGKFRDRYKGEIRKFDKAIIQRIMKDPKYAGRLDPEAIVGSIFRKGETSNLLRVKKIVPPGTWERIQGSAMEEVLSKISKRTDDPFIDVFAGKEFLNALDSYGESTLGAVFGRTTASELYRLGRVTQLVTQKQGMTGGLVAANIALHPLKNLTKLMRLRVMGKFLRTPFAVRWLTDGLKAPNTRRGAAAITRLGVFVKALAEQHTTDPLKEDEQLSR